MSICRGCGMVLGRDCFNEQDCMWISESMQQMHEQEQCSQAENQDVDALHERIKQLEQDLAEAKKDQARYQWLRDQNNFRGDLYPFVYNDFFDKSYFFEELDSIVDAAIKESSK